MVSIRGNKLYDVFDKRNNYTQNCVHACLNFVSQHFRLATAEEKGCEKPNLLSDAGFVAYYYLS